MRRQLIAGGLAVFALLLFASISATVAAPRDIPLLQTPETGTRSFEKRVAPELKHTGGGRAIAFSFYRCAARHSERPEGAKNLDFALSRRDSSSLHSSE